MSKQEEARDLGSSIAKGGFRNEDDIVLKFNNWKEDPEARAWLNVMGYNLNEIENVTSIKLNGYKTDVQVQVRIETKKAISVENLSVKLVSNPQGYNQIDKRWVDKYKELWDIPNNLVHTLKLFTGELKPKNNSVRDKRRLFLNEMNSKTQNELINFFKENKIKIVTDILMGRGQFAARWMLVTLILKDKSRWVLKPMNETMNVFGVGEIMITKLGSLKIGKITMQRKGGDAGRETANMLQFKINPCDLFKE